MSTGQIRDMCWGLLGVQVVWGLQNVNTSRIFQTLGASLSELPMLWIAAPITGLLVQPIIGYLSDHTHSKIGRRRPYMILGALLTAAALVLMAESATLWSAVAGLWILTASVNVVMHPFRALVADQLVGEQRNLGYSMQVVFVGAGAIFASALPWLLSNVFGVAGSAPPGELPWSLKLAFYIGAVALLATVGWTFARTKEAQLVPSAAGSEVSSNGDAAHARGPSSVIGVLWIAAGAGMGLLAAYLDIRREIYLLAAIVAGFGVAQMAAARRQRRGMPTTGLLEIVVDIVRMPDVLRRLAIVQFFAWFGLFTMWVYAIPAVTSRHFVATDTASASYNAGADWVGILFACYDGVAIIVALGIPQLVARFGLRAMLAVCLLLGAGGLASLVLITEAKLLWVSAIGIGCAWAAILSIPYVLVANAVPPAKVGVYMGIQNIFLVLPQLVGASVLGLVIDRLFDGQAVPAIALAAVSFAIAGAATFAIPARSDRLIG